MLGLRLEIQEGRIIYLQDNLVFKWDDLNGTFRLNTRKYTTSSPHASGLISITPVPAPSGQSQWGFDKYLEASRSQEVWQLQCKTADFASVEAWQITRGWLPQTLAPLSKRFESTCFPTTTSEREEDYLDLPEKNVKVTLVLFWIDFLTFFFFPPNNGLAKAFTGHLHFMQSPHSGSFLLKGYCLMCHFQNELLVISLLLGKGRSIPIDLWVRKGQINLKGSISA